MSYKPYKIGYTTGKFAPLTEGHELLLSCAANICERLVIHMSSQIIDPWPVSKRMRWVENYLRTHHPGLDFVVYVDQELDHYAPKDADGTIVDPVYWEKWMAQIRNIYIREEISSFDVIITSDKYGEVIAEKTNAQWIPVDPKRENVPVTATMFRNNPTRYGHTISPFAMADVSKKIAIIGPESVGKSTLCENLKNELMPNFAYVNEYGRTLYENVSFAGSSTCEFWAILHNQRQMVLNAARKNYVTITDTESLVTLNFFEMIHGEEPELEHFRKVAFEYAKMFDMFILLDPSVPYVDDGSRNGTAVRTHFYANLLRWVVELKLPHYVVTGTDFINRTGQAGMIIDRVVTPPIEFL